MSGRARIEDRIGFALQGRFPLTAPLVQHFVQRYGFNFRQVFLQVLSAGRTGQDQNRSAQLFPIPAKVVDHGAVHFFVSGPFGGNAAAAEYQAGVRPLRQQPFIGRLYITRICGPKLAAREKRVGALLLSRSFLRKRGIFAVGEFQVPDPKLVINAGHCIRFV